jgi:hypothetical protein
MDKVQKPNNFKATESDLYFHRLSSTVGLQFNIITLYALFQECLIPFIV